MCMCTLLKSVPQGLFYLFYFFSRPRLEHNPHHPTLRNLVATLLILPDVDVRHVDQIGNCCVITVISGNCGAVFALCGMNTTCISQGSNFVGICLSCKRKKEKEGHPAIFKNFLGGPPNILLVKIVHYLTFCCPARHTNTTIRTNNI